MVARETRLPPLLSIYLDFVRFGAAVVVVLHHAWPILFPRHPLPWPGHDAVAVFFVLSGLVISHATNRAGLTGAEYVLHRAARITSVAVPALILSALVCLAVRGAGLTDAAPAAPGWLNASMRLGANFFYVGQVWAVDTDPPINAPFWSLNFEVWYYVLFGACVFLNGARRAITIAVTCMIAGPKILFLLPVWLVGVALYHLRPQIRPNLAMAEVEVAPFSWTVSGLGRQQLGLHVLLVTDGRSVVQG